MDELNEQLKNDLTTNPSPTGEGNKKEEVALIIVCDDASFVADKLNNFLWVTFTRSNPSHDMYGVNSFTENKHWGCKESLIIDARIKPHHAPPMAKDGAVEKRIDALPAIYWNTK
jgi:4-hydroxy-3-polyprenylbenzoate decarboxylase